MADEIFKQTEVVVNLRPDSVVDMAVFNELTSRLAREFAQAEMTSQRDHTGRPQHRAYVGEPQENTIKISFVGEWTPEEKISFQGLVVAGLLGQPTNQPKELQ